MWRLARSLDVLRDQVDAAYPRRSKSSDGTIGDQSHAARKSDHNPNSAGVVQAIDITHDPANGVDSYALAETLRLNRDRRIKYVISNRRIFSSKSSPWTWRPYSGANAHAQHVHISVNDDPSLYDATEPWQLGTGSIRQSTGAPVFNNIVATFFTEAENSQVAYSDVPRGWGARYGVALPDRFPAGPRPKVKVTNPATGKSVVCDIVDVGPWNIDDPYWQTGGRPQAESGMDRRGRTTNGAGIDLTPAAAQAIGLQGKGLVSWEFVTAQPEQEVLPPLLPMLPGQARFDVAGLFRYVMEHPQEAAQSLKFALGLLSALNPGLASQVGAPVVAPPPPPPPPPPPAPSPVTRPSVQLSAAGLGISTILQALGIVGTPFGMGQEPTTAGTLATLIPIATGLLGATGGFGSIASIAIRLLGGIATAASSSAKK